MRVFVLFFVLVCPLGSHSKGRLLATLVIMPERAFVRASGSGTPSPLHMLCFMHFMSYTSICSHPRNHLISSTASGTVGMDNHRGERMGRVSLSQQV